MSTIAGNTQRKPVRTALNNALCILEQCEMNVRNIRAHIHGEDDGKPYQPSDAPSPLPSASGGANELEVRLAMLAEELANINSSF